MMKCFCFPFAGGSKYSYNGFIRLAKPELEMITLELPGHGSLVKEKLMTDVDEIVDYLFDKIKDQIYDDYIFYGHSMGSLVGYLLTKKIVKSGLPGPLHLFLSGSSGPSKLQREVKRYQLPKERFITRVKELGGVPDGIDDETLDFFEPIIRADFQAIENYEHLETEKLDIPISVAIGKDENVTLEMAQAWERETSEPVQVTEYSGNHFFIFEHAERLIIQMKNSVDNSTKRLLNVAEK
ncbi:MAG: alpha/beta fold hydrolase [Bacteroidota bacterium]